MEDITRQEFDTHRDYILDELADRYGCDRNHLRELGSFESFVYEFSRGEQSAILKLTHDRHRSHDMIRAELDWVNYLARGGVSVASAVASVNGNLVERIKLPHSSFFAYAFEKAPGGHPRKDDFGPALFESWGTMIGRMHALTRTYRPSDPTLKRYHWYDDPTLDMKRYEGIVDPVVIERFREQVDLIRAFPVAADTYGLTHNDLHQGNFYVADGRITAFDFDDCHYNYFVNDIAMALFYTLRRSGSEPGGPAEAIAFLTPFLRGYFRENRLDQDWIERIPAFLKMREIDLYLIIHAYNAVDGGPWISSFLDGRRERIIDRRPVADLEPPHLTF